MENDNGYEDDDFATELGKGALSAATLVSAVYLTVEGLGWLGEKVRNWGAEEAVPRKRRRKKAAAKNTAKAGTKRTAKAKKQPAKPATGKKPRKNGHDPRAQIL